MVDESMLDNAIDMALEEITDIDNIDKDDIESFKMRLNHLLDLLKEDCE